MTPPELREALAGQPVSSQWPASSPPGLRLKPEGQTIERILVRRASNESSEPIAPFRVRDEGAQHRPAEEFSAARKLRGERDLPQMPIRAERFALGPIHAGFKRQAETIVEMINRPGAERGPLLPGVRPAEFGLFVQPQRLHGKMGRRLDGKVIRHPEAPGFIEIRT